jgi:carbamoyl-phosphate synthase large subunit
VATRGTAAALKESGVDNVDVVLKIQEGRPNASDLMKNNAIKMMFITSTGNEEDVRDGRNLRRLALALKVPIITTLAGANATVQVRAHTLSFPWP